MRHHITIISCLIVAALIMASLTIGLFMEKSRQSLPPVLLQVDSLCNVHPQQAIRILDSVAPTLEMEDEYVRNKYDLLTIKTRDKALMAHTSDSLIKGVVRFYDANGNDNERTEAYYYLGSVYRDLHDFPQAVKSYLKGIDIANGMGEDFDTTLVVNIYSQLSYIFFTQYNYEQARAYAEKGLSLLSAIGRSNARSLMDIATCFFHENKRDSAFAYYQKALKWMEEHDGYEYNLDILAEQASNYAKAGKMDQADRCHVLMESHVRKDNLPHNYYIAKASYFQHKNHPDSAIHYFEETYRRAQNVEEKCEAAHELQRLYHTKGDTRKSLEYALSYTEAQDSIWANIELQQTADTYNEYNYRRNVEDEAEAYRQSIELWRRSVLVASTAIVAVLIVLGLYWNYRKKAKKHIKKKEQELWQRDEAIKEKEVQLHKADEIITQSSSIIKQQKEEIKLTTDRNTRLARTKLQGHFNAHSPKVYATFREAATGKVELTENDWQILYDVIAKEDKDFMKRIQKNIKRITNKNIKVCYLLKIGFTWIEIMNTMGLPRTTAFRKTKELTEQLGDALDNPEK